METLTSRIIRRTFTPRAQAERDARTVTVAELASRATGAASLAMRGNGYDIEDRRDCAAEIVTAVIGKARSEMRGRPAEVLAWIAAVELSPWGASAATDTVPADCATFTALYGHARNIRRSLDRTRDRDAQDTATRAASGGFIAAALGDAPRAAETVRTPDSAASAAREMMRNMIGTPRKGDAPVFTLCYSAARASAGLESTEIAAELDLSPALQRQNIARASKRLRAGRDFTPADFADALEMPDTAQAYGVHVAPLSERADRVRPEVEAEVTVRTDRRIIRKARPPQWARELEAGTPGQRRTAARLAHAARIRDGRADR